MMESNSTLQPVESQVNAGNNDFNSESTKNPLMQNKGERRNIHNRPSEAAPENMLLISQST